MDIDWSKAPEGATHCDRIDGSWLRNVGSNWYIFGYGEGVAQYFPNENRIGTDFIPRPTKAPEVEWDGEGLPPVGCECEFLTKDWRVGKVACYVQGRHGKQGIVQFNDDWQCFCNEDVPDRVRPLRTKEQREREKLELVLKRWHGCTIDTVADAILSRYNLEPKP